MDIKRNEATLLRPEGDRVLDAPFVTMDFNAFTRQLKDEKAWEKNDRNGITLFKSGSLTTVLTCFHKKSSIRDTQVDALVQVQVLAGKLRITTDAGDSELGEGEMVIFHPGVRHSIEAIKKSTVLLQTITVKEGN